MGTDRTHVVVTGLGAITPLGADVASTWEALLAGRSGVTRADRGLGRGAARPDRRLGRGRPGHADRPGAGPPAGPVRAVRAGRRPRGLGRRGRARGRPGAARRRGVQRHRRHRVHACRLRHAEGEGLAAALAVHRADADAERLGGLDQHRARRPGRGAHHGERVRVRRRGDRLRHGHDQVRPGRRRAGRRHRGRDHAAEHRRVRGDARPVHPQRRAGARLPPVRQGPGRLRARRGRRHRRAGVGGARGPPRRDRARGRGRRRLLGRRAPHRPARPGRQRGDPRPSAGRWPTPA